MRALLLVVFLAGCAIPAGGFTVAQEIAVVCRGYASTLSALTPFKGQMTAAQIAAIDDANLLVIPTCKAVGLRQEAPTEDILRTVRDRLREMLILEQKIKSAGA